MINLNDILKEDAKICVTVSISELRGFADYLLNEARQIYELEQAAETYITEKEVRQILNVSHSTLYRWNKDKYLPVTKVGGKNLYPFSKINEIKKINNLNNLNK